jgi:hypothetical protein
MREDFCAGATVLNIPVTSVKKKKSPCKHNDLGEFQTELNQ